MNKGIIELFTKYYHNFCSREELDEVMVLLREGKYSDEWEAMLMEETIHLIDQSREAAMSVEEMESLNQRILCTIGEEEHVTIKPVLGKLWLRVGVAAAIIFVLGIGIYFYAGNHLAYEKPVKFVKTKDIAPGKNGATLTLASGKKIKLSDALNGELAEETGVRITKTAEGQIVYENKAADVKPAVMNSLSTGKGETFQIRLPDGTKVWLNAASTLTYTSSFRTLKYRKVSLIGEAYFEVVDSKKQPFIVESNGQKVQVLGTHFNVNSYLNESAVKTTLLEGSVRVIRNNTNETAVLQPNQECISNEAGRLKVQEADIHLAVAWKNNQFMFDSESIEGVMKTVARWYDVDIVFEGEKPTAKFVGSINRTSNLSKVLELLASTGGVHFRVEYRTIYVSK